MELARRYLGPPRHGIEIGASALNPFEGIDALNVDLLDTDVYQRAQATYAGSLARVDIVGTAQALPFRDEAVDFVLASHVLEHMPDTVRALREWDRAVRPGGCIFLIVPHRDRTFDRLRPRTQLEHHLADYARGITASTAPMVPNSHHHVWITADLVRLVEHLCEVGFLAWDLVEVEDVDTKVGNGFTLVARKRRTPEPAPPAAGDRVAFHQLALDLPFQVIGRTIEYVAPGARLAPPPELPRGRYRAWPIYGGFPPRAGSATTLDVGEPVPPPEIESIVLTGESLEIAGRHITPTTWLEATYPDGTTYSLLPDHEGGRLIVPVAGRNLPVGEAFPVTPVNLPPGGGRGPEFVFRFEG